ncbi:MAG: hypothetical protein KAS75_07265 [Planctomycetes bacterium]|nr:hypothetical protein [Planctomycetota bacterium]
MSKIKPLSIVTCVTFLLLVGCAKQQRLEAIKQICLPQTTKAEAIAKAENVLGQMHFAIDKIDAEQGYIRTRPLPAAQFFEFWRSDTIGAENSAEANIHNIQRTAELNIKQQGQKLCINCNVKVQRLSLSQPKGSSEALAHDKFSSGRTTLEKRMKLRVGHKTWIDLGNDDQLETVILKRLEKQITKQQ